MQKKNHILFIVENSLVPLDVRVWSEALSAKEFGYNVTVICPKGREYNKNYEKRKGIKIYRHPRYNAVNKNGYIKEYIASLLWEIYLSLKVFLREPFNVIHGANPPDHLFILGGFFKIFGVKYIFDHHDLAPESYLAKFGKIDRFYKLLLMVEKLNFRFADIVISTNESYKEMAIHRGGKKKENVFVVRNGPRLEKLYFPPSNKNWKKNFKYLVAYIGMIGVQDQLEVLLKIIKFIVLEKNIKDIKFIVIGTGPNFEKIVRLSKEMGISNFIEFTGYLPYGHKVFEIFSTSDICVNPELRNSFTDKSTMLKIMEYMSFGKPIVQFDTTEGRFTAGDSSHYVKNNDISSFAEALIDIIKDENKKRMMGRIGKKRIENMFQWKIQKMKLKSAYDYLITVM